MEYIGEHLNYGIFGHFLTMLTLVASLVATISFFYANKQSDIAEKQGWLKIARLSFLTQTITVITIFGLLLFYSNNSKKNGRMYRYLLLLIIITIIIIIVA
jgi:cytochrome c-type biogenesis protein CcmF